MRIGLIVALMLVGCAADNQPYPGPELDVNEFRCNVEPVLMARCGFYACHGNTQRPFVVYAPNRFRMEPSVPQLAMPLTLAEQQANYDSARGMADSPGAAETQLLAKPLDADNGGQFHRGKSIYLGRDVFTTDDDVGYQRIAAWLGGAQASDQCEPTDEVGP